MVLMMAKQESAPRLRWPKALKRRVGNNSRKPRVLTKNRNGDSLSQGMVEKEDDVAADDDDDDMMRTGVSQNRVTVIL